MHKLNILRTNRFKKNFKRVSNWPKFNRNSLEYILEKLSNLEKLDIKYRDHQLNGGMKDYRECHIQSDILLIYEIKKDELILLLIDIGSHSEMFG